MNQEEFEILIRARDEFSQALKVAQEGFEELTADINKLGGAEQAASKGASQLVRWHQALSGEVQKSSREVNKLNRELGGLIRAQGVLPGFDAPNQFNFSPLISQVRELKSEVDGLSATPVHELQRSFEDLSPAELASLQQGIQNVASAQDQLADASENVGQTTERNKSFFDRLRDSVRSYAEQAEKASRGSRDAGTEINLLGIKANFTVFQLLRLVAALGGVQLGISVLATTVIGLRNAVINFNRDLETATLQFTTIMGSAQLAEEHLRRLYEFAANTPFAVGEVIEGSRQLEVFGSAALNNIDMITRLGDVSAAYGVSLKDITFWVGRFYGALQDSRPLGEMLSRFQELGVITPTTRTEIEALAKAGGSLQEIWEILLADFDKVEGAMEDQADTWRGLASTMADNAQVMLGEAFKPLFEFVKQLFRDVNEFLSNPETQRNVRQFASWLTDMLAELRAWLEVHVPKAIAAFKGAWSTLGPTLSTVAGFLGLYITLLARAAQWILENERVLQLVIAAYVGFRFQQIAMGLYGLAAAWYAKATATIAASGALQAFKAAMIQTGIGALLVGIGMLIWLVATNWDKSRELIVIAGNGIITGIEWMANKIIEALEWVLQKSAGFVIKFLEVLVKIPEQIRPFGDQIVDAHSALTAFMEDGLGRISIKRIPEFQRKIEEAANDVDDFIDPLADLGEERPFDGLIGNFEELGGGAKKAKTEMELLLEAMGRLADQGGPTVEGLIADLERFRDIARHAGDQVAVSLIDRFFELDFTIQDLNSALGAMTDRFGDLEDAAKAMKEAYDDLRSEVVSDINLIGGLLETAIKRQAQGVLDGIIDGQKAEREAIKKLQKDAQDIVNGTQDAMTDAVHAGTQDRIKAIIEEATTLRTTLNAELAAIQQRLDELSARDFEHSMEMLDRELKQAWDPREIQKLLDRREQMLRRQEEQELKARQKELQDQLKTEESSLVDEFKTILDDRTGVLDRAEEIAREAFKATTDEFAMQSKIRTMFLNGEFDEMARLLDSFVPEWRTAGLSYGEQLIEGIRDSGLNEFITGIFNNLTRVQTGSPETGPGALPTAKNSLVDAYNQMGLNNKLKGVPEWVLENTRKNIREMGGVPSFKEGGFARSPMLAMVGDRPGGEYMFGDDQLRKVIREEVNNNNIGVRVFIGERELTDIVRIEVDNTAGRAFGQGALERGVRIQRR